MTVNLSDRELYGVGLYLGGDVWGGPDLAAQRELWIAINGLVRFAAAKPSGQSVDLQVLSDESMPMELSEAATVLLKNILQRPGQPRVMGLLSAAALARIG